jgi:Acyl-coenzyme A oxidase N-terminal
MSKPVAAAPRMGSIKNKIVASDLEEERKKCNFDQKELSTLIWGGKQEYERILDVWGDLKADKGLQVTEKWYDMTREELMEDGLRRLKRYYDTHRQKYFEGFVPHYIPWWCVSFVG